MKVLIDREVLESLFYQAISVAHFEGESLGAARHKNTQCLKCAADEENENLKTYGRDGPWPIQSRPPIPMVGFGIAERSFLAKRFADHAEKGYKRVPL